METANKEFTESKMLIEMVYRCDINEGETLKFDLAAMQVAFMFKLVKTEMFSEKVSTSDKPLFK